MNNELNAAEEHIDDLKDYYEAVKVSARIRRGEEELVPLEEVRGELFGNTHT